MTNHFESTGVRGIGVYIWQCLIQFRSELQSKAKIWCKSNELAIEANKKMYLGITENRLLMAHKMRCLCEGVELIHNLAALRWRHVTILNWLNTLLTHIFFSRCKSNQYIFTTIFLKPTIERNHLFHARKCVYICSTRASVFCASVYLPNVRKNFFLGIRDTKKFALWLFISTVSALPILPPTGG